MSINLLPDDKSKDSASGLAQKLSTAGLRIGVFLVLLSGLLFSVIYFYSRQNSENLKSQIDEITTRIQSLESDEQRLYLTKNRLEMFAKSQDQSIEEQIPQALSVFYENEAIPSINEITGEGNRLEILHTASSSAELKPIFEKMSQIDALSVALSGLTFNPFIGYRVGYELLK